MAETNVQPNSKPCIACFEAIHAEARLCPHCRTPQKVQKWRAAGSFLKWIGGVTAVISLVIGAYRVNELYQSWRDRSETVKELVSAAELQRQSRDFEGGWRLIEQALELEPGARRARRLQISLAMDWIRNIAVRDEQTFSQFIDPLLPALYRGAGSGNQEFAADALAHIGWANFLKRRDGNFSVEIDSHYRKALALDPGNVYARTHWGHWLLWTYGGPQTDTESFASALDHFKTAIEADRDEPYVARLALIALFNSSFEQGKAEGLRFVNLLRQKDVPLGENAVSELRSIFGRIVPGHGRESGEYQVSFLTGVLPPEDLLAVYTWALDRDESQRSDKSAEHRFVVARLIEASGDKAKALALFEALSADESLSKNFRERAVTKAIARLRGTMASE